MCVSMIINDEHITEAEKLFIDGNEFDQERRSFIHNLETNDLLAVPGSGKTTVLLAKLYCMSQQLPLENNAGILVLSHTNKAIDEIKKKLKPIVPKLFTYPNFVGTVQAFANQFLANQACFKKYGSYIKKNEDELVYEEILRRVSQNYRAKSYLKRNRRKGEELIDVIKTIKHLGDKFLVKNRPLRLTSNTGKYLDNIYSSLRKDGVIFYEDSFELAFNYLEANPEITKIIKKRFKYVFVDEMQDLDEKQVSLIEEIFYSDNTTTVIQRIGDKNQSIFSSSNSLSDENVWKTRNELDPVRFHENLTLNNTYRLGENIAKLVDCFVLNRDEGYEVVSARPDSNNISPYLLVYKNEEDAEWLRDTFIELIKKYELNDSSKNIENGFYITSWTTEKDDNPEIWHLKKLFPEFSKETNRKRNDFDCLKKHFCLYNKESSSMYSIRRSLLNAITRILRIEGVLNPKTSKPYNTNAFIQLVKDTSVEVYFNFNKRLLLWCYLIEVERNYHRIYKDFVTFINGEVKDFIPGFKVDKANDFISKEFNCNAINEEPDEEGVTNENELEIQLSSIHGVKGQTHCATMYVETEYYGYETIKLKHRNVESNPLYFEMQSIKGTSRKRIDDTLKMMYVGFSRPTHLLCFAVKHENVEDDIDSFHESGWKIININDN